MTAADPHGTSTTDRSDIANPAETAASTVRALDTPLSSRAIFWQPRHVTRSPLLVHLPYLFWLVESGRPRRIVQVGLGDGVGFMAFCQAVDKLDATGSCLGITTPDTSFPDDMRRAHAEYYSEFSAILQHDDTDGMRAAARAPIDMLVLDAQLTETMIAKLQARWMPSLSERAVVVVLNPEAHATSEEARDFLRDIADSADRVAQPAGRSGPRTILAGRSVPERLARLAQLDSAGRDALIVEQVFGRLGQAIEQESRAAAQASALESSRQKLDALTETLGEREDDLAQTRAQLKRSETTLVSQEETINTIQSQLFDLRENEKGTLAQLQAVQKERDEAFGECDRIRAQLEEAQEKRQGFYAQNTELKAKRDSLITERDARVKDIAVLTKDYDKKIKALERRIALMESSTSWRITAPIRAAIRLVSRRK